MGSLQTFKVSSGGCLSPENKCNLREFNVALRSNILSKLGGGNAATSRFVLLSASELMKALIIFVLIVCMKSAFMRASDAGDGPTVCLIL